MADLQLLRDLSERVRKATGPDSRLDAEIACALVFKDLRPAEQSDHGGKFNPSPSSIWTRTGFLLADDYTSSIDATVALIERVSPGCWRTSGKGRVQPNEPLYGCAIYEPFDHIQVEVGAGQSEYSEPLAILDALLSALISIEESKQGEGGNG